MTKSASRPAKKRARVASVRIAEALRKSGGVVSHAAEALGVGRSTLTRRLEAERGLRDVREDVKAETLDLAESTLVKAIKAGNLQAVIFYLRTQGRERGYVERSELGGTPDAPPIKFYMPKKVPLPPDDEPLATMSDDRHATKRTAPTKEISDV